MRISALTLTLGPAAPASALELQPIDVARPLGPGGVELGRYSPRTLRIGVEIDRYQAGVVGHTIKPPAIRPGNRSL